ncbi:hypothetical protein L249_7961 [Ophiocordyceps polyrhachis-furcata BCC 54312]|uniref:2EXR domain-containing protein n=1 Tax=Ophiocordyceps polyrhachis-furcata BCC 54312 TaxID=1330021 RepID=A0A367LHH1_9HYPO|nr:hypothetical protein L249_7961 [Ophiocordyceps polyrhachis-furcata BCC 54312]
MAILMAELSRSPRLLPPKTMRPAAPPDNNSRHFHLFPLLPPELRLKIWNMNLPPWRLVPMHCDAPSPSLHEKEAPSRGDVTGFTSNAPIPVNLHVCAESRAEAMKRYRCVFDFARGPGKVIFNPDDDILLFGPRDGYMAAHSQFHTCMAMCDQAELASVRHVAISESLFWGNGPYSSRTDTSLSFEVVKQLAKCMPSLKTMLFVSVEEHVDGLEWLTDMLARQVQIAINRVRQQNPHWRPPPWHILSMDTLSKTGAAG